MKNTIYIFFILVANLVLAQSYEIEYTSYFEGKERKSDNPTMVLTNAEQTLLLNKKILGGTANPPFEVTKISRPDNEVVHLAFLKNNQTISTSNPNYFKNQIFTPTDETKKILNYKVKKATTTINSNAIEVWYTNDLKVKGGPSLLGQDLGLVLEVVRNGSHITKATSIKKIKKIDDGFLPANKNIVSTDGISYQDLIWKSRFTTLSVFENEIINFTAQPKSGDGIERYGNGTIILKKIKFPEIKEEQNIFVELKEQSNGDAYDRTGSVFIIPEERKISLYDGMKLGSEKLPSYTNGNGKEYKGMTITPDFLPIVELMRFYTPFGISHFNENITLKAKEWHKVASYREDITDLKPSLSGKELWVGAYIGNYDQGGHKISLEITLHNSDQKIVKNNFALPLFATINVMENAGQTYATLFDSDKGLVVEFDLKNDLKDAQLRYTTTGHGGWGNGDEFVPKENSIYLDDKLAFAFTPWRTDCGSYRLYNPVSGNFDDGLSSSDLSRSNWCPGSTTNPVFIPLGDLKAGKHKIQVRIPQGSPEGNSFSYWNTSGILLGTEE